MTSNQPNQKQINRINEIIADNEKVLNMLKDSDRLIEGKILAYKHCLQLIGAL